MYFYHAVTDTVHHILGENRIYRPRPLTTDNIYRYRYCWSYFNFRLSCLHGFPFLSLLSNPGCPILDVQPVLTVLDRLSSSQLSYFLTVLSLQSCPCCPFHSVGLSNHRCHFPAALSLLSCPCCPIFLLCAGCPVCFQSLLSVLALLSGLSYIAVL